MSDSGSKQPRTAVITALVVTGFGIGWLAGLSVSPVVSIVLTSVTGIVATMIAALSGVKEEFLNSEASPKGLKRLRDAVTPVPIAYLVAGVVIGVGIGVWVRTHDLLSPETPTAPTIAAEVDQWVAAGLTDRAEVARRLFESRYAYRGWLGADLSGEVQKWTKAGLPQEEIVRRLFESSYPLAMTTGSSVPTPQPTRPESQSSLVYGDMTKACGRLAVYLVAPLPSDPEFITDFETEVNTTPFENLLGTVSERELLRQVLTEVCRLLQSPNN